MNMRKFIPAFICLFIIIGLLGSGFLYYRSNSVLQKQVYRSIYPSQCDNPITYRIDRVDKEFNISKDDFTKYTADGVGIWNKAYGESLFKFDANAALTVNLVFDERQRLTNQIGQLSTKINESETQLKPEIARHQQQVAEFEKQMKAFNDKVKYWNDRGGAPEEEYNKLVDEQSKLKGEANSLNERAQQLNQSAVNFNSEISNYNETVSDFNSTLKERPEEGLFNGKNNTITIFFYINNPELVHTLTHEFGHSLGMEHVLDPKAVMFTKTNQSVELSNDDREELARVCARTPVWEMLRDRYFQTSK